MKKANWRNLISSEIIPPRSVSDFEGWIVCPSASTKTYCLLAKKIKNIKLNISANANTIKYVDGKKVWNWWRRNRRRKKKEERRRCLTSSRKKRMHYLLGPESEASPAPPVPSSSKPGRPACWSTSSPGGTLSSQTPGCSSGRGEEEKGSQVNFKGRLLYLTLHFKNCRTAAYNCTGNLEGNLNSGLGKTTALP